MASTLTQAPHSTLPRAAPISDPEARDHDLGPDWRDRHINHARKTRQHVRQLEDLGYTVTLAPAT
jgi:hypothetical protein